MNPNACGYRLRTCVWEITLACCFSCKYCGSQAGMARRNELTTQECLLVAEQLADMGCERVSLIGGEVFMRDDWSTIASALTGRGVVVAIITNGFLFSSSIVSALKSAKIESVGISIDGPEAVHDAYRQAGSFRRAIEAMDTLAAGGIPVSVISTLHSKNVSHLDELYGVLKEKPLFAWQLQACSPMGNAARGGLSTHIDFGAVIRFVEDHAGRDHFAVGIADNIGYYTQSEGWLRGSLSGNAVFMGCRAGLTSIGIDSVGNVRGCESMYDESFVEGNLRERSLAEIWNDPGAFRYNRGFELDMLGGACKTCDKSWKCAGGCRSYNHFSHGKLYESPCCARRPGSSPGSRTCPE